MNDLLLYAVGKEGRPTLMEETVQETDLKRARKLEPDSRAEGLQRGNGCPEGAALSYMNGALIRW